PDHMSTCGQRRFDRLIERRLVDVANILHVPQHIVAALQRAPRVAERIVPRTRLRQAGEHCDLGECQLVERRSVVDLRRRGKAVRAMSQKNIVYIEFENLILRELALNFERKQQFLQLTGIGFLGTKEKIPRHLHRYGAAALARAFRAEVVPSGAQQTENVDAVMLIKVMILGGEDRLYELRRHGVDFYRNALLFAELRDQLAVRRVDPQRHLELGVGQLSDRRKRGKQRQGDHRDDDDAGGQQPQQGGHDQLPPSGGQMGRESVEQAGGTIYAGGAIHEARQLSK